MKYYAQILKCKYPDYWYSDLIGEIISIKEDICHEFIEEDNDYEKFYVVEELTDRQIELIGGIPKNVTGHTLLEEDIVVYDELELRSLKIKDITNGICKD